MRSKNIRAYHSPRVHMNDKKYADLISKEKMQKIPAKQPLFA
jgi:hypothetical protein